jgi:hypothetical protein
MTTNLYCLVDGQITSNAFPVKIKSTETIGDLKGLIMATLSPQFDNIKPKDLIIRKVSNTGGNSGSAIEIGSLVVKRPLDDPSDSVSALISEDFDDNMYNTSLSSSLKVMSALWFSVSGLCAKHVPTVVGRHGVE